MIWNKGESALDAIREYAADARRRYREGNGLPPSNDPERPPAGPASGSLANPQRTQVVVCYHCCGDHEGCTKRTEEQSE